MKTETTAIILIGYQNDYFSPEGILHSVIEESSRTNGTVKNTVHLLSKLSATDTVFINTPIIFTDDYRELDNPVGILKTITEVGAFKKDTIGAETIPSLRNFGERVIDVPGKRGLNAFSNTDLDYTLMSYGIEHVVIAGAVTSICIDSTGRAAHERGYSVTILSDCISGRSQFEQDFYCQQVFPLYAEVMSSAKLMELMFHYDDTYQMPLAG